MTGKELLQLSKAGEFKLWSACRRSTGIIAITAGRRFLRLDKNVEGYARLSPSILREFYSYTVISTRKKRRLLRERAARLERDIADISREKWELARRVSRKVANSLPDKEAVIKQTCFMIAGDTAYSMAHNEPRPEPSTGLLVKGSDLDIIIVVEDLPPETVKTLDDAVYKEKQHLLVNPAYREELDYIVKDMPKVEGQMEFSGFKSQVASKILYEADFLYGSTRIYNRIKEMLFTKNVIPKILRLEARAREKRDEAESYLLRAQEAITNEEALKLFYTAGEREEIF